MIRYIKEQVYRFKYSNLSMRDKIRCAYWDLIGG
jgi:hypothetical protein